MDSINNTLTDMMTGNSFADYNMPTHHYVSKKRTLSFIDPTNFNKHMVEMASPSLFSSKKYSLGKRTFPLKVDTDLPKITINQPNNLLQQSQTSNWSRNILSGPSRFKTADYFQPNTTQSSNNTVKGFDPIK